MPEAHPQNLFQYIYFSEKFNPWRRGLNYKIVNILGREIPLLGDEQTGDLLKTREAGFRKSSLSSVLRASHYRELLMVLKIFPTLGPIRRMIAITTMATNTRMIAYSTNPCPFSCGWNNMDEFLSE